MTSLPIEVEGLTRYYGKRRGVMDLTFEVQQGEIFCFLGPNEAGKTTTIRQLMGLMRPDSGSARVFGLDCWHDSTKVKESVPNRTVRLDHGKTSLRPLFCEWPPQRKACR